MLFEVIFSSGGHFVRQNGTICAILVEGIIGNIQVKLLKFHEDIPNVYQVMGHPRFFGEKNKQRAISWKIK